MTSTEFDDRRLAGLHAPRRNRYYAGKVVRLRYDLRRSGAQPAGNDVPRDLTSQ